VDGFASEKRLISRSSVSICAGAYSQDHIDDIFLERILLKSVFSNVTLEGLREK
jgi:hypothetical protein